MARLAFRIRNASPVLEEAVRSVLPRGIEVDEDGEPLRDVGETVHARIRLAVARRVFGREFRRGRDLNSFLGTLGDEQYDVRHNAINAAMLPLYGVGPDSFWLNENLGRDRMRGIANLLDYDREGWGNNEAALAEEGVAEDSHRPYRGGMLWEWARWFEGGDLVYGMLSLAVELLLSDVDDAMSDWLDARFPTTTKMRKVDGDECSLASLPEEHAQAKIRIMGECQAEMQRRLEVRWHPWFEAQPAGVAVNRRRERDELHCDVSFMNTRTLAHVRPRSFLADLAELPDASDAIGAYAAKEIADFLEWLRSLVESGESVARS